jgi:hypothetical protein
VASATVIVKNIAPSVVEISGPSTVLTGKKIPFEGSATNPSLTDTRAGFGWRWSVNNGPYELASNPFSTTFSSCGQHTLSVRAADKDGGVSEAAAVSSVAVSAYEGHFRQPLDEGAYNPVQAGMVVSVKVTVGCGAEDMASLRPSIQLLKGNQSDGTGTISENVETYSVSAADTTGVMRPADGFYIYNLRVPEGAQAGELFTIRVRPFGDDNPGAGDLYAVLKVHK